MAAVYGTDDVAVSVAGSCQTGGTPLSVLLYFGRTCLLGMDMDNITPARYTVYGVREGGGSG